MGFTSRGVLEEASADSRLEATYRWSYCEYLRELGVELKM